MRRSRGGKEEGRKAEEMEKEKTIGCWVWWREEGRKKKITEEKVLGDE